ncbi:hypothetical protein PMAYCL1PPCAC_04385, partial [Pristionchus mayeri]
LGSVSLPDSIRISHPVPEELKHYAPLLREGKDCDCSISIGDRKLKGHKALLSARSAFFRGLFASNDSNADFNLPEISLTDFDAVQSLLVYAYAGCLTITQSTVKIIFKTASRFELEAVVEECITFMRRRFSIDSLLSLLRFSEDQEKLREAVLRFADRNFVPFSQTSDFLQLSINELRTLLKRDSLYDDEVIQTFDATTRWNEVDVDRLQHSKTLLECIRCTRLSESFLMNEQEQPLWMRSSDETIEVINKAKRIIRSERATIDSNSFAVHARVCEDAHQLIFAIGNAHSRDEKTTMELYNPMTNTWTVCEEQFKPFGCRGRSVINRQDNFYGRAGVKPGAYDVFDSVANVWTTIPIYFSRSRMACGVIDGK